MLDTRFLDGTRFFLAFWVVIDHFYALIGGPRFYTVPLIGDFILLGSIPVNGFIAITGFLMTYHYYLRNDKEPYYERKTIVSFWLRRVFRLYPVYLIAIIGAFLVPNLIAQETAEIKAFLTSTQIISPNEISYSFGNLLSHLTFTHGLFPGFHLSMLVPAWSLSLEMQYYLLFPLIFSLFFLGNKKNNNRLTLLIICSILMYIHTTKLFGIYGSPGTVSHFIQPSILIYQLPIFIYGMVLAGVSLGKLSGHYLWISMAVIFPFENKYTVVLLAIITALLFLDKLYQGNVINKYVFNVINGFRKLLSCRVGKFGADISYSLYLTHWLILPFILSFSIDLFEPYFNKYQTIFIGLILYIFTCTIVSYILFVAVEKPFIAIGKKVVRFYRSRQVVSRKVKKVADVQ